MLATRGLVLSGGAQDVRIVNATVWSNSLVNMQEVVSRTFSLLNGSSDDLVPSHKTPTKEISFFQIIKS